MDSKSTAMVSKVSKEEVLELEELEREQDARIKSNPLKYFWPHQKNCSGTNCLDAVLEFDTYDGKRHVIRGCPQFQFCNSKHDVKGFFGSNQSGKTTTGCVEIGYHTIGDYPPWWQGRKWTRPTVGRIFASDFTNGVRVITDKLHEWIPPSSIAEIYRNNQKADVDWYVKYKNGGISKFQIMSYEQEVKLAEGWIGDWCIEENQRVLKSDGTWIAIKDIKLGDELFTTHDNYQRTIVTVLGKKCLGEKPLVKVKAKAGYEVLCTAEHKFWTTNGWVEAKDLKGKIAYSPTFDIKGKNTISKELAFMLGVWIGDGWFNKCLFIANANKVLLSKIEKCVERISHKERYDYRIVDQTLKDLLIKENLINKKCYEKFVPEFMFREGDNILHFLNGLYSTDGWFAGHIIGYGSTSKRLAEDIRFLLRNLGIQAGLYFKKKQDIKWRDQWFTLITQKDNLIKFCELVKVESKEAKQNELYNRSLLLANKRIDKKIKKVRKQADSRKRIISVEDFGVGNVYDISVDTLSLKDRHRNAHSFICNGLKVSNCWFDEPPPRELYIATARGLIARNGLMIFTLTPLREPWLFDEIYNSKNGKVFSVLCDMRHNTERLNPLTHRLVGFKEEWIRKFEEKLTEEERETRMHGKFRYLAGRVWKEWDRDIHTFDRMKKWPAGKLGMEGQPPRHWPRCMILDPHDRNPHALLWVAMDETGESWFYREAWLKDMTIEDVVEHIRKVELEARERVALRIIDPNFGPKRYANTGNTVRDEFEQAGRKLNFPIRFAFGDDHKEVARKAVSQALRFDSSKPLGLLNHPQWHIASDLKECIYQVEHYIWDEFKLSDRDPKEKPKDINTHYPDCFSYYSLSNFRWQRPKISEGRGAMYVGKN